MNISRFNKRTYQKQNNFSFMCPVFRLLTNRSCHWRQMIKQIRGKFFILWKLETIYWKSDQVTADLGKRFFTSKSGVTMFLYKTKKMRLHRQLWLGTISTEVYRVKWTHYCHFTRRPAVSKQHSSNTNQLNQLKGTPSSASQINSYSNNCKFSWVGNRVWIVHSKLSKISLFLITFVY